MDVPRKKSTRLRIVRRFVLAGLAISAIFGISYVLTTLENAPPVLDRDVVYLDTVQRGEFIRQVRGNGILVPKEEWWISAPGEGRVEDILVDPGEKISGDQVMIVLSNTVLESDVRDAEWKLAAAEAELRNQEALLEGQLLDREENVVTMAAQLEVAVLEALRDQQLFEVGLMSEHERDAAAAKEKELVTRLGLAERRYEKTQHSSDAALAVQRATVEQFRSLVALRKSQMDDLNVRAEKPGVVQDVLVETGQQVTVATSLAKLSRPDVLQAELLISETQTKDILTGQPVTIDTRQGVVPGRVSRIDPAVQDGTVTVEVELEGPLPKSARPDMSVEGTIELERVEDVLHVGRPVGTRPNGRVSLFRLTETGAEAIRVAVLLGRNSVNSVEIEQGLNEGDRVILSDMSRWERVDRVRLR